MPQLSFRVLSYLFLLAVMVQFFLAGMGIAKLGGESIEAHKVWGYAVLHLIPLLMFGTAIWAKMGRATIAMVFVLFVLVFIQPAFISDSVHTSWIRALHALNALFIFTLGFHIAQRSGLPMPHREA